MGKLQNILEDCNKEMTKEQLEEIIYSLFCLMIFITPVIPEVIGYGLYSLKNTLFNVVTIITVVALIIINRKSILQLKPNIYDITLIIYFLLVVLSTLFTKFGVLECILGTNGRGEGLITIFSYLATFVIFSRGYKRMHEVSKAAIIAAAIVAIYSVIQANLPQGIKIPFIPESPVGVATGTMRNQNFLSSYICIFLPMTCYYYINGKIKLKRTLIVATLLFLALVYSVTLGGYVTFGFMCIPIIIFSLVFSKNKNKTLLRIAVLSLTLITTFIIVNYDKPQKYVQEVSQVKQEVINLVSNDDKFAHNRTKIWKKSLAIIKNNPVLGVGPDSMDRELSNDKYITEGKLDYLHIRRVDKAHSEPLHIAVTTGIPSALTYVIFVGIIGIRLLVTSIKDVNTNGINNKQALYVTMVLICFASYLIQSLVNISVVQVAPMFWGILGTAAGITTSNKISTL